MIFIDRYASKQEHAKTPHEKSFRRCLSFFKICLWRLCEVLRNLRRNNSGRCCEGWATVDYRSAAQTAVQGWSHSASPRHTSNVPRKAQPEASSSLPLHYAQSLVEVSCFRVAFQDECYHEIKSCGNEGTIGGLCRGSIGGCEDEDSLEQWLGPVLKVASVLI